MTIASFQNIQSRIEKSISDSRRSISIAVAWMTNKELLGRLTDKLENNCIVEIIISDDSQNRRLDYRQFIQKGGTVKVLRRETGKFLHHKFAIFDNRKILAGSYNWTYSAETYNHEFIVESEEERLVKQFQICFNNLINSAVIYDNNILANYMDPPVEIKETEYILLEEQLKNEFIQAVDVANNLGAQISLENINKLIFRYGAIGMATRLINRDPSNIQSGLMKLWEIKRLDLSFEQIILEDKYRILFNQPTLENAQVRLNRLQ